MLGRPRNDPRTVVEGVWTSPNRKGRPNEDTVEDPRQQMVLCGPLDYLCVFFVQTEGSVYRSGLWGLAKPVQTK